MKPKNALMFLRGHVLLYVDDLKTIFSFYICFIAFTALVANRLNIYNVSYPDWCKQNMKSPEYYIQLNICIMTVTQGIIDIRFGWGSYQ